MVKKNLLTRLGLTAAATGLILGINACALKYLTTQQLNNPKPEEKVTKVTTRYTENKASLLAAETAREVMVLKQFENRNFANYAAFETELQSEVESLRKKEQFGYIAASVLIDGIKAWAVYKIFTSNDDGSTVTGSTTNPNGSIGAGGSNVTIVPITYAP